MHVSLLSAMSASYASSKTINFRTVDGSAPLQLEEVDIAIVIDNSFVYPSHKNLKDQELAEVPLKSIFHYKCDSNKCNFPLDKIRDDPDLKAFGIRDTADIIATTIESNQQLFTARLCGGYILQAAGKPLALIKNDSVDPVDDTRFGFVDLTDVRRRLIRQYEVNMIRKAQAEALQNSKKAVDEDAQSKWLLVGGLMGGVIGAGGVLGLLKLIKKI